jgi:hypothetical protein
VERPDSFELANIDRPDRIIHGQASNGSTGLAAAREFHFSEDVFGAASQFPNYLANWKSKPSTVSTAFAVRLQRPRLSKYLAALRIAAPQCQAHLKRKGPADRPGRSQNIG